MALALGGYEAIDWPVRTRTGKVFTATDGMDVVGADGVRVGQVKAVSSTAMLVDRSLQRDVFVPFEAIDTVTNNQIVLTIPSDQVDRMHWPHPTLI